MWCRTLTVVHVKLRSSGALMVNVPLRLWKCVVIALYLLLYGTAWSCTPRASDALQSGPWTDTERWQQTWRSGVDWIWFGKLKIRSSGCVAISWLKSSWQFWYKIDHWHQKWWIVCQTVYIFASGEGAVRRGEAAGGRKVQQKETTVGLWQQVFICVYSPVTMRLSFFNKLHDWPGFSPIWSKDLKVLKLSFHVAISSLAPTVTVTCIHTFTEELSSRWVVNILILSIYHLKTRCPTHEKLVVTWRPT